VTFEGHFRFYKRFHCLHINNRTYRMYEVIMITKTNTFFVVLLSSPWRSRSNVKVNEMPKSFFGGNFTACGPTYFKYRPPCSNSVGGLCLALIFLLQLNRWRYETPCWDISYADWKLTSLSFKSYLRSPLQFTYLLLLDFPSSLNVTDRCLNVANCIYCHCWSFVWWLVLNNSIIY